MSTKAGKDRRLPAQLPEVDSAFVAPDVEGCGVDGVLHWNLPRGSRRGLVFVGDAVAAMSSARLSSRVQVA